MIDKIVWYEPSIDVLDKDEEIQGVFFKIEKQENEYGPTLVLNGCYRLGEYYSTLYGGRIDNAIDIIAVERSSGKIYHAAPVRPETVPLIATYPPENHNDGMYLISESAYFNADLCKLLGLPGIAAEYIIYLVLDKLVEGPIYVSLPENPDNPFGGYYLEKEIVFNGETANLLDINKCHNRGVDVSINLVESQKGLVIEGSFNANNSFSLLVKGIVDREVTIFSHHSYDGNSLKDQNKFEIDLLEFRENPRGPEKIYVYIICNEKLISIEEYEI